MASAGLEFRFEWRGGTGRRVKETLARKLIKSLYKKHFYSRDGKSFRVVRPGGFVEYTHTYGVNHTSISFDDNTLVVRFSPEFAGVMTERVRWSAGRQSSVRRARAFLRRNLNSFLGTLVDEENKKSDLRKRAAKRRAGKIRPPALLRPGSYRPTSDVAVDLAMNRTAQMGLTDIATAGALSATSRWHNQLYEPNGIYWIGVATKLGVKRSKRARKTWKRLVFEYIRKTLLSKSAYALRAGGLITKKRQRRDAEVSVVEASNPEALGARDEVLALRDTIRRIADEIERRDEGEARDYLFEDYSRLVRRLHDAVMRLHYLSSLRVFTKDVWEGNA